MSKRKAPRSRYGWVSQETWDAALASKGVVLVTVHGTGDGDTTDAGTRWWQIGSDFFSRLGAEPPLSGTPITVLPFHWSGANSDFDRYQSSKVFRAISRHLRASSVRFFILAHSHGGNVALHSVIYHNTTPARQLTIISYGAPIFRRSRMMINISIYAALFTAFFVSAYYVAIDLLISISDLTLSGRTKGMVDPVLDARIFISKLLQNGNLIVSNLLNAPSVDDAWGFNAWKSCGDSIDCTIGAIFVKDQIQLITTFTILLISTTYGAIPALSYYIRKYCNKNNSWHYICSSRDEVLSLLPQICAMRAPQLTTAEATARRWRRYGVVSGAMVGGASFLYLNISYFIDQYTSTKNYLIYTHHADHQYFHNVTFMETISFIIQIYNSNQTHLSFAFYALASYLSTSLLVSAFGLYLSKWISNGMNSLVFNSAKGSALGQDHDYKLNITDNLPYDIELTTIHIDKDNLGNISTTDMESATKSFYENVILNREHSQSPNVMTVWKEINKGIYHNAYFRDDEVIALTAKIIAENKSKALAR